TANRAGNAPADAPAPTPKQLQATAHARGRICKVRTCKVCAPLREKRRLSKAQRKADAQTSAHAKGEPCGRNNCPVPVCVQAKHAEPAPAAPAVQGSDESTDDAGTVLRRQTEKHRAGLSCGLETCGNHMCVEGFAQERARRHRARRPCKSADCDIPICVASRSGN
ncbi:MAG TPA: hypothetical protein VMY16_15725, partial [Ilumatobacteraceae bacterium]|nr:hypothetical protein [Ilumatobacteraceae bacterium]